MWLGVVSAGSVLVACVVRADRGLLTGCGEGRQGSCGLCGEGRQGSSDWVW